MVEQLNIRSDNRLYNYKTVYNNRGSCPLLPGRNLCCYIQTSIFLIYIKDQGVFPGPCRIRIRLLLPLVPRITESFVDQPLRVQPGGNSIIIIFKASQIEPLSFKSNVHPVLPVLQLIYTAESACIIPSVLSLLQDFYTGTVHHVELFRDIFLILTLQAAAALYLPRLQVVCCDCFLISTVTLTYPGRSSVFIFSSSEHSQTAESLSGQILLLRQVYSSFLQLTVLHRTVTLLCPPYVHVNRVRSNPLSVISSMAVGLRISTSTTS